MENINETELENNSENKQVRHGKKIFFSIIIIVLLILFLAGGYFVYSKYGLNENKEVFKDIETTGTVNNNDADEEISAEDDLIAEEQRSRNHERLNSIYSIAGSLDLFKKEEGYYPEKLNILVEKEYLSEIPGDEKPNLECGDEYDFKYELYEDKSNYKLIFCMEEDMDRRHYSLPFYDLSPEYFFSKGENFIISARRELTEIDSDGDGLKDYEEIYIFGTDSFNPDTDGDGFSDGDEVRAGFNPLGEGTIDVFSTPESAIQYLEKEVHNGKFELYFEKTYFPESFERQLNDDLNLSLEEFKNRAQEMWVNIDITKRKVGWLSFNYKEEIDYNNVYLRYIKYDEEGKYIDDDLVYLIKINDEWIINFEPEYEDIKKEDQKWSSFKRVYMNHDFVYDTPWPNNEDLSEEKVFEIIKRHEKELYGLLGRSGGSVVDFNKLLTEKSKQIKYNNPRVLDPLSSFSLYYMRDGNFSEMIREIIKDKNLNPPDEELLKELRGMVDILHKSDKTCEVKIKNSLKDKFYKISRGYDLELKCNLEGGIGSRTPEKKYVPYAITSDKRIRFYDTYAFIPYDLFYDGHSWKIGLEESLKHINKINYYDRGIKNLNVNTTSDYLKIMEMSLVAKALEEFKSDKGYYPKKLAELFPDYYIYKDHVFPNEFYGFYEFFKYFYSPENDPQFVNLGVHLSTSSKENLLELRKKLKSDNFHEDEVDGERVVLFDLHSSDFSVLDNFLEDLLATHIEKTREEIDELVKEHQRELLMHQQYQESLLLDEEQIPDVY